MQVIVPKNDKFIPIEQQLDTEIPFRGRFYLTMVETHLKVIDTANHKIFDLLTEPSFDQDYVSGMALIRSLNDKQHRLFILCQGENGNFIQKIEMNHTLTATLAKRVSKQIKNPKPQANEVEDEFFNW